MPAKLDITGHDAKELYDRFKLGKELGRGQFGVTFLATEKANKKKWACKCISKRKLITTEDKEDVKNEVAIMHHLAGHDNIVHLKKAYEDSQNVQLLMEICEGGELFDRIVEMGHYSEKQAAESFRTIMTVVAQCHALGIMHRDLKPENFLLSNREADCLLKATDFGLSVFFTPGQKFKDVVGSAYYVAPEVLKKSYGPEADTWSAGVILYILLCGVPPFWADNEQGIFKAVLKGEFDLTSEPWNNISDGAKDIVRRLLKKSPEERMTATEALEHPWLREGGTAPDVAISDTVTSRLKKFADMNRFKKTALQVIASNMTEPEIKGLKELFRTFDKDESGTITLEELSAGIESLSTVDAKHGMVNPQRSSDMSMLLKGLDTDGDGTISYEEFITATINMSALENEETLWKAFKTFDEDGSGYITYDELQNALQRYGTPMAEDEVKALIAEADSNKDGKINYEEFSDMMRDKATSDKSNTSIKSRKSARLLQYDGLSAIV